MRIDRIILLLPLALAAPAALAVDDDEYRIGRSRFGAFVVPVPIEVQIAHDLAPGEGVLVLATRNGGTADRMGIAPGDVVLSLNGNPLSHRRDVRAIVRASQPGDDARADVVRADGGVTAAQGAFQPRQPFAGRNVWSGAWERLPLDLSGPERWRDLVTDTPEQQRADLLERREALAETAESLAELRAVLEGRADAPAAPAAADAMPWSFAHAYVLEPTEAAALAAEPTIATAAPTPMAASDAWSFTVTVGSAGAVP